MNPANHTQAPNPTEVNGPHSFLVSVISCAQIEARGKES